MSTCADQRPVESVKEQAQPDRAGASTSSPSDRVARATTTHYESVPDLITPTERVHESYLAALEGFHAEGAHTDLDIDHLRDVSAFRRYVRALIEQADPDAPRLAGYVPGTVLWWVDGAEFLGRLSIRHYLTETLSRIGGHIGYDVAPAMRRRGHATAMLAAALPIAAALGIDPALITCERTNVASCRVIERNGGRPDTAFETTLRFWVSTGR